MLLKSAQKRRENNLNAKKYQMTLTRRRRRRRPRPRQDVCVSPPACGHVWVSVC